MQIKTINSNISDEVLVEAFCRSEYGFALESTLSFGALGRWSFYGSNPFKIISEEDGISVFRDLLRKYKLDTDCEIPFVGGAVGFFSYDYGRSIEMIPSIAKDDLKTPPYFFGLYDGVVARDNVSGELYLVASELRESAEKSFKRLKSKIESAIERKANEPSFQFRNWKWDTSEEAFCNSVNRIQSLIASGDVYQVNLSRRREAEFSGDSVALYQALRKGNPAPYCGYLNAGELQLISTSPEQFIKKDGSRIVTRPIKGTRPRGKTQLQDKKLAEELELSEKDRAELLMIIDLERNDLGRVSEFGSISADTKYTIEYYQSVMHATAEVRAKLMPDKDILDLIHAMFPGGSITGAPKVRAMEIIDELEPNRRGIYCGSFGYIGFNEHAELNISIRTLQLIQSRIFYNVGSGIVWDSDPKEEYYETVAKGKAIEDTLSALC
jgi:para-aminobenzoate synthetase component 1